MIATATHHFAQGGGEGIVSGERLAGTDAEFEGLGIVLEVFGQEDGELALGGTEGGVLGEESLVGLLGGSEVTPAFGDHSVGEEGGAVGGIGLEGLLDARGGGGVGGG